MGSGMSEDGAGLVQLFQVRTILGSEFDIHCGDGFLQMVHFGGSDNRSGQARLMHQPGQGYLGRCNSPPLGQRYRPIHHLQIAGVEMLVLWAW